MASFLLLFLSHPFLRWQGTGFPESRRDRANGAKVLLTFNDEGKRHLPIKAVSRASLANITNMDRGARQEVRVANPPHERPVVVYDGDCSVCREWISRWQAATGDRIDYEAFQNVAAQFPEISRPMFEEAVQLIETDGSVSGGADAVFRLFDFAPKKRRILKILQRIPGFMPIARAVYAFTATHRTWLAFVTRLLWRPPPRTPGEE